MARIGNPHEIIEIEPLVIPAAEPVQVPEPTVPVEPGVPVPA